MLASCFGAFPRPQNNAFALKCNPSKIVTRVAARGSVHQARRHHLLAAASEDRPSQLRAADLLTLLVQADDLNAVAMQHVELLDEVRPSVCRVPPARAERLQSVSA